MPTYVATLFLIDDELGDFSMQRQIREAEAESPGDFIDTATVVWRPLRVEFGPITLKEDWHKWATRVG